MPDRAPAPQPNAAHHTNDGGTMLTLDERVALWRDRLERMVDGSQASRSDAVPVQRGDLAVLHRLLRDVAKDREAARV